MIFKQLKNSKGRISPNNCNDTLLGCLITNLWWYKNKLVLILLFLGVLLPLLISPFITTIINEGLENPSTQKYYANETEYFEDMNQKIQQLEDIYNDNVNGSQSKFPLSDPYKRKKMTNTISSMNDWKTYKYKTDLKKIIEGVTRTDDAAIMKSVMDKASTIKQEIASKYTPPTKKPTPTESTSIKDPKTEGNFTDEQIQSLIKSPSIKSFLIDKMDEKGKKYMKENPSKEIEYIKNNFKFYSDPEANRITVISDSWGGKNYDLPKYLPK